MTAVTVAVVPLTSGVPEGPQRAWRSTLSPAWYSRSAVHPGPTRAGPVSAPVAASLARTRSARSSASVCETTRAATCSAP